jgi:hypothetical protein
MNCRCLFFVCHSAAHPGSPASGLCSLGWSSGGICFCRCLFYP